MELMAERHLRPWYRRFGAAVRRWWVGLHEMAVFSCLPDCMLRDIGLEGRIIRQADPYALIRF